MAEFEVSGSGSLAEEVNDSFASAESPKLPENYGYPELDSDDLLGSTTIETPRYYMLDDLTVIGQNSGVPLADRVPPVSNAIVGIEVKLVSE